ncbi:MAG: M28 family peptidase [Anaerolineae bacterium]|nr:M28 family peptidase [Anaerolineae bacterium]
MYASHERTENWEIPPASTTELSQTTALSPTQVVWEMLSQVNEGRALNDLSQLTGEEPICAAGSCHTIAHRLTGSEGLDWAMDYISETLISLGYSVESQDWTRSGYSDRNLIARKLGVYSPTEEVYFVAHVDGVKIGEEERFPAADDNGGGSVDLLEVARVLSTFPFSRTVVLLFTTGEEQGTLGSRSYLEQLSPPELGSIKYVVNVDVIGYDANGDQVMELAHGEHPPSQALAQVMSATIDAYQLNLDQRMIVGCP